MVRMYARLGFSKEWFDSKEPRLVDAPMLPNKTPGGPMVRPTTEHTFSWWLEQPFAPPAGTHVVLVSSQPSCLPQKQMAEHCLSSRYRVTVVGPKADESTTVARFMREVAGSVYHTHRFGS